MAQFYAVIQGSRGAASRMGTKSSGIWGHIRGWDIGCKVVCYHTADGKDRMDVFLTHGSNGGIGSNTWIGTFEEGPSGPVCVAGPMIEEPIK